MPFIIKTLIQSKICVVLLFKHASCLIIKTVIQSKLFVLLLKHIFKYMHNVQRNLHLINKFNNIMHVI